MPPVFRFFWNWITQLQTVATLSITISVVIVAVLTINAIVATYEQVSGQLAKDQYRRLALAASERLSGSMENYMLGLNTLASQAEMQSGEPTLQEATLQRGASLVANFTNRDAGIIILDEQGFVSVTNPFRPDLIGKDFSKESYFQTAQALGLGSFSNVLLEPGTNKPVIVIATPIINQKDEFVGVIAARLYIQFRGLNRQIEGLSLSNKASIYLVDRVGNLIYHPIQHLIGTDFNKQEAVKRLLQDGEFSGTTDGASDSPVELIEGFAVVPITDWGVIVTSPLSEAVQPAHEVLLPAAQVLVIGVFLVSVMVSFGAYRVALPIRNLVIQIRNVTAGDYDAQVTLSRFKELRDLGEASNEMVDQIRKYRAGTRQYIADVTRSQEEERKRIARDLHDDTVQSLIAVGQRVDLAKTYLDEPEEAKTRLSELRKMVNGAIASVRQFSRDLRPLALEDLGLISAMQYLVNQLSQYGDIVVDLEVQGEPEGLSPEMEVAIYRILQESLNNVKKHARATEVDVLVVFKYNEIIMTVEDDGRGFEMPKTITDFASKGSFGVMGLQERAQLFGGRITLESEQGKGTRVKLVMPRQVSLSPFDIYHRPYLQGSKVADEPLVSAERDSEENS
ncbi:cache domain-containing protein [Anaerolineales bacterium HSG25]|nr:cache domain-containing protein [Anaerolineales bacterium HSG25]